jgi:hypothetical protein
VKSVKEILQSPQFHREISVLFFVFAAFSAIFGILFLLSGASDDEVLGSAVLLLFMAVIYAVLATFIRRGSVIALWIAVALFAIDTVLLLVQPLEQGSGVAIIARAVLVFLLIRFVLRERARA